MKVTNLSLLVVLAALCACSGKAGDPDSGKPSSKPVNLSVMSFNVRSSAIAKDTDERHWDKRKGAVRNMVKDIKPDVIGMQEATTAQRTALKALLEG